MTTLYALCKPGGKAIVKRVGLAREAKTALKHRLHQQEASFLDGVDAENAFNGGWTPDPNELSTIDAIGEAVIIEDALKKVAVSVPPIDPKNFRAESIRALFAPSKDTPFRTLVQLFTPLQVLQDRFTLMIDGSTFKELSAPAFTLDNQLTAIIEGGKIKFKNYEKVKRIFELKELFVEATDPEIDAFCAHKLLKVEDVGAIKRLADQSVRKKLHAINKLGTLDNYKVTDIVRKAKKVQLTMQVDGGKLVLPQTKRELKIALKFLTEGIYKGILSDKTYETNSHRPFST
jgi:hypothetical protein